MSPQGVGRTACEPTPTRDGLNGIASPRQTPITASDSGRARPAPTYDRTFCSRLEPAALRSKTQAGYPLHDEGGWESGGVLCQPVVHRCQPTNIQFICSDRRPKRRQAQWRFQELR